LQTAKHFAFRTAKKLCEIRLNEMEVHERDKPYKQ
jgi:hypothetical protein